MKAGIVIPTLNEADHIGGLLSDLANLPTAMVGEILVADGGSTDGTTDIVRRHGAADARIRLIENPRRFQSSGINGAVGQLGAEIDVVIRIDAHAHYPADYVPRLLESLDRTGADSVVIRLRTIGGNCVQNAIALVSNQRIGTGGSDHRMGARSRYVDHGHHAAFRRRIFEQAGGYDPAFRANEDAELDYRIRKMGGTIWLDAEIMVDYAPRKTIMALARQYWRYGIGRAQNYLKHRERLRLRQLIPPAVVLVLMISLLAGIIFRPFLLIPLGYMILLCGFALMALVPSRSACALYLPLVLAVMHLSWGAGFIVKLSRGRANAAVQNPFD